LSKCKRKGSILIATEEYFDHAWNLIYVIGENRYPMCDVRLCVTMFRSTLSLDLFSVHKCNHVQVLRIYGE